MALTDGSDPPSVLDGSAGSTLVGDCFSNTTGATLPACSTWDEELIEICGSCPWRSQHSFRSAWLDRVARARVHETGHGSRRDDERNNALLGVRPPARC